MVQRPMVPRVPTHVVDDECAAVDGVEGWNVGVGRILRRELGALWSEEASRRSGVQENTSACNVELSHNQLGQQKMDGAFVWELTSHTGECGLSTKLARNCNDCLQNTRMFVPPFLTWGVETFTGLDSIALPSSCEQHVRDGEGGRLNIWYVGLRLPQPGQEQTCLISYTTNLDAHVACSPPSHITLS